MINRRSTFIILACTLISLAFALGLNHFPTEAQAGTVHAVLFYSPTCPHCEKVINQDLPPLQQKYGEQLNIFTINVGEQAGQALYRTAIERFNIPEERRGVPCLIVGDTALVGSREIPDKLPGMIEDGVSHGGIPWPDLPGLSDLLPSQTVPATEVETASAGTGFLANFSRDTIGNLLAVFVLIGLIASATLSIVRVIRPPEKEQRIWPEWAPFALIIIGIGIALYLSYVELTHTQAICGPVGDCNTVQQSPYATLFDVIPVGVIGIVGYVLIALAWLAQKYGINRLDYYGALAAWAFTLFGVLFFIYLTFLEPFVIGATCAWCLTSAIVMILLLWASTAPAIEAWKNSE